MNCPERETIQNFLDDELSETESHTLIEHIQSCKACKEEFQDVLSLHHMLSQVITEEPCPSYDELEAYAVNPAQNDNSTEIQQHIELCNRCRFYVWALQSPQEELSTWQAQDEKDYKAFCEKELGINTVRSTLEKLLPAKLNLLEKSWNSLLSFVLDLKNQALENWPSFDQRSQLVGVLGFSESYEPETEAASIIMTTTLYVSQLVSDGEIGLNQDEIFKTVNDVATKLGAGKELRKRLIETVPSVLLRSQES